MPLAHLRPVVTCCALALALLAGPSARVHSQRADAQQPAQDPLTFRSGVEIIEVDVFVTDRDGNFVRDLTKDDFEIREDGTPQEVRSLSFVDLPIEKPAPETLDISRLPEPDVTTNDTPAGRIYVFLMDSPSTAGTGNSARGGVVYDAYVKRFARQFIEESVMPGDRVAVVHAQGTSTDSQAFTTNKQQLVRSVDRYGLGRSGAANPFGGHEAVARNMETYRAIQHLSERLGAMSGRRKAILWIGGQMVFDPLDVCPRGLLECPREDQIIAQAAPALLSAYEDAIGAATRNNVAIYPIDPSGLGDALGSRELSRIAALRMVAEDTGGIAVVNTNNYADHYEAIVRENSTYYVLGYSPSTVRRDGEFHRISVRVNRPGVTVRARKGYFAPSAERAAEPPPVLPDGVSAAAANALRLPIPVRGLLLDVFSAPFKRPDGTGEVVIGGQITGDLRLDAGDQVVLSYQVIDIEGRVQTGEYLVYTLNLRPDRRAGVAITGVRFVDRLALPPGRYELRLVSEQPAGSLGSLVAHLDVPKFDEGLALSGVLLGASSTAGHPTLQRYPNLQDRLGMHPTAIRRLPQGDVVTAYAEVYSDNANLTADDITLTGIVTTAAGEEVKREPGWLVAGDEGRGTTAGRWGFTIELGLTDVEPGRYVLTVEALSARRPNRPVTRQIPFEVVIE